MLRYIKDYNVEDITTGFLDSDGWDVIELQLQIPSPLSRNYSIVNNVVHDLNAPINIINRFSKNPKSVTMQFEDHSPGTVLSRLEPIGSKTVHVPIQTNDYAYIVFDYEGWYRYNLEVGKAYIVNTNKIFGYENFGKNVRQHLTLRADNDLILYLLKL